MKVVDKMADIVRNGIRSFLRIEPAQTNSFYVQETLDYEGSAAKHRIWYRGDADELSELYKLMPGESNRSRFWAAVPTVGLEIRKIHTGLPAIIVDTLVSIVLADVNDITVDIKRQDTWNEIEKENHFKDLLDDALSQTLYIGDGAFKISVDTNVSQYPILEYVPGDQVDYELKHGRITEIIFRTPYDYNYQKYTLFEIYGYGYIRYELKQGDKTVELSKVPELAELQPVTFDPQFMMAVPFRIFQSSKWRQRGKSVFDGRTDNFDALDEAWSQWMDALRHGRSKEYIPENMLPRNPHTGELMRSNSFDNAFIATQSQMVEGQLQKIELIQPEIPHDSYLSTYVTCLDMCLQGIISPSTLGIDGNKLKDDTATAQLEREKVTLYTRSKMIEAVQTAIPELVNLVFKVMDTMEKKTPEETEVTVEFGEYNSPGFDAVIDTVGKAKQSGIMSLEAAIDEMYGDSKDEEWKAAEVLRLKAEQGISDMEEPMVAADMETAQGGNEPAMTTLNGAQIGSLMNMIGMVKSGQLTRSEAINIVSATLGIPRESAETFIEETI